VRGVDEGIKRGASEKSLASIGIWSQTENLLICEGRNGPVLFNKTWY
jgi:hypothetical protein